MGTYVGDVLGEKLNTIKLPPRPRWQLVYVVIHANVKRVLLLHKSRHPGREDDKVMDVSYDGVKLTNSCGRSFEVSLFPRATIVHFDNAHYV